MTHRDPLVALTFCGAPLFDNAEPAAGGSGDSSSSSSPASIGEFMSSSSRLAFLRLLPPGWEYGDEEEAMSAEGRFMLPLPVAPFTLVLCAGEEEGGG